MKYRFTIPQLVKKDNPEYKSDLEIIHMLLTERLSELTQGTPLAERLRAIQVDLKNAIKNK